MTINPNGDRRPRRDETRIMRLPDSLRAEFADAHRRQVAARDAELTAESPETARDRLSEEVRAKRE